MASVWPDARVMLPLPRRDKGMAGDLYRELKSAWLWGLDGGEGEGD